jgi:hypothetical protein
MPSEQICWAVTTAARFIPGAACLVQSLVGRTMLLKAGYPADIRIGVSRLESGMAAHAWVCSRGAVLLGGDVTRYTELHGPAHEQAVGSR